MIMNRWKVVALVVTIYGTQLTNIARTEEGRRQDVSSSILDPEILSIRSQLNGVVKPVHQAVLRTPTSGIVRRIAVAEGQVVQKGQPLLSLDDTLAKAAVATAQAEANRDAQIRIAEISLLQAKAKLNRIRSAVKQNAASQFELDAKISEYESALANRDLQMELQTLANAKLAEANAAYESLTLKAPFNGLVIQIHPNLGDSIDATRPAVTVVQLDKLEVEMHLPVDLYRKVSVEKDYELKAYAPVNRVLNATAQFVSPIIEPTSGTFRCVFRLDNSEYSLPAGFQVQFVDESQTKQVSISKP